MAHDLTFPRFDYMDDTGTITAWLKNEGEEVRKGEPIYETESEKATQQVEAPRAGIIGIFVPAGTKAQAGDVIGVLAESKEELERALAARRALAKAAPAVPATAATVVAAAPAVEEAAEQRVARRARILAERHGIELATVRGTGPSGRIMPEDILRAVEARQAAERLAQRKRVAQTIPFRGIRKTIAQHLSSSLQVAAQVTNMTDADGTNFLKLREELAAESEKQAGVRISYNDILVALCARALRESPMINSSIIGDEIKVWQDVNVGVAVNTEEGLMVPVIHQADEKSLLEIHDRLAEMIQKCQNHTITAEEMAGGTFTISNASRLGIDYSTAIINPPESAILAVGRFVERPVVVNGAVAIRPMIGLSLTFDHRVVDGVYASAFLVRIAELIANPGQL